MGVNGIRLLSPEEICSVSDKDVDAVRELLRIPERVVEETLDIGGLEFYVIMTVNNTILGYRNYYGESLGGIRVMDYKSIVDVLKKQYKGDKQFDELEARRKYASFESGSLARKMTEKWAKLALMGADMSIAKPDKQLTDIYRSFLMRLQRCNIHSR